jgi:LPXTG-motif cell wall-anchored protein
LVCGVLDWATGSEIVMKRVLLMLGVVATVVLMAAPANADDGYPPSDNGTPPAEAVIVPSAAPAEPPAPSGGLPRTGDDSSMTMARVAIGFVAAGGLLVLAARRRRATLA